MIDTNKVLEQIHKLILAYTKDKKLDSNRAKYVLKTAVEKVLEFNSLNIEAAETIVSAIEKSKVLEKIKTLDFNRLSSNKDYVDPLYGKPINVKQVLSIVHGVIDSQIKSLDAVLLDSQNEEVKSEINEIKSSPIARFSPNAYKLLSKRLVLLESEDLEDLEDLEEESKPKPYKKLLEIAKIIYKDNPLAQIKEIIAEFKNPTVINKNKTIDFESKKKDFVSNVLSIKRGKIVEAIFLKNLEENGSFSVKVEGGGTYVDDILPILMKEGKSSFNLYSLYNKIISNGLFEIDNATIDKVKTFVNFNEFIEGIPEFSSYNELCRSNIDTFFNKIKKYFESISGKIKFGAFKTKFNFSEENIKDFYFIENESVKEKIDKNENIKNISVVNNCFIPKDIKSPFDFYLDLKITLEDDSDVIIDKGLCVDVKNYINKESKFYPTKKSTIDLSNIPFTTIINIEESGLKLKTFLTKSLNNSSTYFKSVSYNTFDKTEDFDTSLNNIEHVVYVKNIIESPEIKKIIINKIIEYKLQFKSFQEIANLIKKDKEIPTNKISKSTVRNWWEMYATEDNKIKYMSLIKKKNEIKEKIYEKIIEYRLQLKKFSEIATLIKNDIEIPIEIPIETLGINENSVGKWFSDKAVNNDIIEYKLLVHVKRFSKRNLLDPEEIVSKINNKNLRDKENNLIIVDVDKVNDLLAKLREIQ